MILRGATSLRGALEGVGPENRDIFGPWNGTSEASAIWAQKNREGVCVIGKAVNREDKRSRR